MRGIIVKPTLCCGNETHVGKVVTYRHRLPEQKFDCIYCNKESTDSDVVAVNYSPSHLINSSRIKWFNDDLDKQIQEEDNVRQIKEKEVV